MFTQHYYSFSCETNRPPVEEKPRLHDVCGSGGGGGGGGGGQEGRLDLNDVLGDTGIPLETSGGSQPD